MPPPQTDYPHDLAEMMGWIRSVVAPGERVLEIGCGDGAITAALSTVGVEVLGVDPHAPTDRLGEHIQAVAFEELDAAPFDVVFASVALHHLPDADNTVAAFRRLTKPGTRLLVREFDRVLLDHEPTLRWWFHQRQALDATGEPATDHPLPATFDEFYAFWSAMMQHHVLPWTTVLETLHRAGFATQHVSSTSYLFRWSLRESIRATEDDLIAAGRINEVGIRWSGRRD